MVAIMKTFKEIINLWPSQAELARDLGALPETVGKWHQRNRVPGWRWLPMVEAAKRRKIPLSVKTMAETDAGRSRAPGEQETAA